VRVRRDALKPTVLHVLECFAGGTERHLIDLVRHVEGFQHVAAVPASHHGRSTRAAARRLEAAGARVERVEMGRSLAAHRHAGALLALRGVIRRTEPDIVHGHSSIGGALARLATVGTSIPVLYTPHALSRSRWALAVERLLRGRTDRMIAVSESEREFALRHRLAPEDRIVVIHNGIALTAPAGPDEPLRTRLGVPAGVPLIGCVGRLSWQKAPEVFVAACAQVAERLPEAHFVLIGAGLLRETVVRAAREARLGERFHLIPSLPDAAAALGELDVYALPSRFEGGPYTPLEAMRAGTPVVLTDVAGNRDVVHDGVDGLLVAPEDPAALAEAIVTLVEDPALREAVVRSAKASVARFDVRSMARATAAVYRELCGEPPARAAAAPGELRARGRGQPAGRIVNV